MQVCVLIVAVAVGLGADEAKAGDVALYSLPEDGAWAEYEVEFGGSRGEMRITYPGVCRIASVGRISVDGKACRWVEVALEINPPMGRKLGDVNRAVGKLLIPEEELARGQSVLDHVIRGWMKQGERDPIELRLSKLASIHPVLPGPLANAKELEAETVETPVGELECRGVAGRAAWSEGDVKFEGDVDLRFNDKVPFGIVASSVRVTSSREPGAVMTWRLKVKRVGTEAVSEMAGRD